MLRAEMPQPSHLKRAQTAAEEPQMLEVFRNTVPVPMDLPGSRFDSGSPPKKPWFFAGSG